MITDNHGRTHNYLRISLTDKCNLRCAYCMPHESYDFMPDHHLMQADEIEQIARVFVSMGVNKIRLTGGEPMARKDFGLILRKLAVLPVELTMTTNATLLHRHMDLIYETGVQNLNISLDTLSEEKFKKLTKRNHFAGIMENIQLALKRGLNIKINAVIMKGVNEDEVMNFIGWTKDQPLEIRFIEFMPFEGNRWEGAQVFSQQEILDLVRSAHEVTALPRSIHDTSRPYRVAGHAGSFAIISTMTAPFCSGCNRMRLTADGKMKNCLFSKEETDILTALRNGEPVEPLIRQNIFMKAEKLGGQFGDQSLQELKGSQLVNRTMISIGG